MKNMLNILIVYPILDYPHYLRQFEYISEATYYNNQYRSENHHR